MSALGSVYIDETVACQTAPRDVSSTVATMSEHAGVRVVEIFGTRRVSLWLPVQAPLSARTDTLGGIGQTHEQLLLCIAPNVAISKH